MAGTKERLQKTEQELGETRAQLSSANRELKDTQRQIENIQIQLNKGAFDDATTVLLRFANYYNGFRRFLVWTVESVTEDVNV